MIIVTVKNKDNLLFWKSELKWGPMVRDVEAKVL